MSLFLHSSNADESAVWKGCAPLCWGGGVVALALTIHDHSSSAELFFIEEALSARARVCVCALGVGGSGWGAGEADWHSAPTCLSEDRAV